MLALALVLIAVGIILMFFIAYAGIVVGIIGLVLLVAFLFGIGRGAASTQPHQF